MDGSFDDTTIPIPADVEEEFDAIRGAASNIALLSVNYDGEPTFALVAITEGEGDDVLVSPLYVRCTDAILGKLREPSGTLPVSA